MSSRTTLTPAAGNGTGSNGRTINGTAAHCIVPSQVDHATISRAKIGVGVIGCGYWGPNLLRNFHSNRDCHLLGVADLNHDRLAWAQSLYPHIKATSVVDDLIADPNIEAIAIATPVHTHFELAMRCLRAGKHI